MEEEGRDGGGGARWRREMKGGEEEERDGGGGARRRRRGEMEGGEEEGRPARSSEIGRTGLVAGPRRIPHRGRGVRSSAASPGGPPGGETREIRTTIEAPG